MKTIISIIEVILYNLFPASFAAPVIIIMKDILPLLGVALVRVGLYTVIALQKIQFITHDSEEEQIEGSLKFQRLK